MSESPRKLFFQTCFVFMPNSHKSTVQKYYKIDLNWNRVSSIEQTKVTKCWRIPLTSKCKQRKGLKWLVEKSNGFSWEKEGKEGTAWIKEVAAQCTLGEFFWSSEGILLPRFAVRWRSSHFFPLRCIRAAAWGGLLMPALIVLWFPSPKPRNHRLEKI